MLTMLMLTQVTAAQHVVVTRRPNWPEMFSGETITLTCEVQGGETTEWTCEWRRPGLATHRTNSKDWTFIVSQSSSGDYLCQCKLRDDWYSSTQRSNAITLSVSDAVLTTESNWSTFYSGEFVTFRCDMNEGENSDWEYKLNKNNESYLSIKKDKNSMLALNHSGEYQCCGHRRNSAQTKCSNTVTDNPEKIVYLYFYFTLFQIYYLLEPSAGWKYRWWRRTIKSPKPEIATNNTENRNITVTQGGIYRCEGVRGNPAFMSNASRDVTIKITFSNKVVVTRRPNRPLVFSGETITLTCEVQGGETTEWKCDWNRDGSLVNRTNSKDWMFNISESSSGNYMCRCRRRDDWFSSTPWSEAVSLSVSGESSASLSVNPDRVQHFKSQPVSLKCEGNSAEWRVKRITEKGDLSYCSIWGKMTGSTCTIKSFFDNSGVFWCESKSGEFSNAVNITVHDDNYDEPLLVSPVHPVTEGDPVTLRCREKDQLLSNVFFYHNDKLLHNDSRGELNISAVSKSDEGFYKCQRSGKDSPRSWMSVRVADGPSDATYSQIELRDFLKNCEFFVVKYVFMSLRCS
uniref:Ig-like domain-containing protein n=1 Tax=Poecilia mexicana TaxID=48701 RepID=A0A3B3YED1_9TELE